MKKILLTLFFSTFLFSSTSTLKNDCLKNNVSESCFNYGKELALNKKVLSSYTYLNKGCQLKHAKSCSLMGNLLLKSKLEGQQQKGLEYISSGCNYGDKIACKILKGMRDYSVTDTDESCDKGNSEACLISAKFYFTKGEQGLKNAMGSLDRACKLGNDKGCKTLEVLIKKITDNIKNIDGKKEYLQELGVSKYFNF